MKEKNILSLSLKQKKIVCCSVLTPASSQFTIWTRESIIQRLSKWLITHFLLLYTTPTLDSLFFRLVHQVYIFNCIRDVNLHYFRVCMYIYIYATLCYALRVSTYKNGWKFRCWVLVIWKKSKISYMGACQQCVGFFLM